MNMIIVFLNSILKETIYIKQVEGFVDPEHPDWVYLLRKALYGLKQSAFEWYNTLKAVLESDELKFKCLKSDHALFTVNFKTRPFLLFLHRRIQNSILRVFARTKAISPFTKLQNYQYTSSAYTPITTAH